MEKGLFLGMMSPCQGLPSPIRVANVHKIRHRIYEIGY